MNVCPLCLDELDAAVCAFTIPGPPVGKGRPRVTRKGHAYTPAKTRQYERKVTLLAKATRASFLGPVRLHVVAVYPRPRRLMRRKDPEGLVLAAKAKPDLDNVIKTVSDGLEKAGVIENDTRVVQISAAKVYSEKNGSPRVEVVVEAIG